MDSAALETGMYLMRRARDEYAKGVRAQNEKIAFDLFFTGIDSLLSALPVDSLTADRRVEMQGKLLQAVERLGSRAIVPIAPEPTAPSFAIHPAAPIDTRLAVADWPATQRGGSYTVLYPYSDANSKYVPAAAPTLPPPTLAETVIQASVAGAVALKQSPLPGVVKDAVGFGMASLKSLDAEYNLRGRMASLGRAGMTKALALNREYKVHERVGDAVLTGVSAVTHAAMAYKNAPAYDPVATGPVPTAPVVVGQDGEDAKPPAGYVYHDSNAAGGMVPPPACGADPRGAGATWNGPGQTMTAAPFVRWMPRALATAPAPRTYRLPVATTTTIFRPHRAMHSSTINSAPDAHVPAADRRTSRALRYPHFRHLSPWPISRFIKQYELQFEAKGRDAAVDVALAGRVVARRDASSKLVFLTIQGEIDQTVQVMASRANFADEGDWDRLKHEVQVGDIAYFRGFPGKTGTGELSLFARASDHLTPSLHEIPFKHRIKDQEKRTRNRVLDLLVNVDLRRRLRTRTLVIQHVRDFLSSRDFLEVDTPVLSTQAGGANARPFTTTAHAYGLDMALRVAPELWLKKLVVAGFDRVFELGKQFRNEGFDATHNPEFVTCEFYMAYANLDDLIKMTEQMLSEIAVKVHGEEGAKRVVVKVDDVTKHEVNFTAPYKVIDVVPFLEARLGALPRLDSPTLEADLEAYCVQHHVPLPAYPRTAPRLLDAIISHVIEPECVQPTFVRGHPRIMSPLAKSMQENPLLAARIELFVASKELVNAYEELNDPVEQRDRFMQQQRDKDSGDVEAQPLDDEFCRALEYGLPPTAGWGLGIDRLCMMLTGVHHIREVMPFPTVRPLATAPEKDQGGAGGADAPAE
ncbi:hypothetical protein GGF31_007790 [Allomyces arbusculus]|nr:hypothetical protein GGF31_007790 [Allomyces arbusculus]